MTTLDRDNALDMERAVYHGELYAFERVERMLHDRRTTIKRIIEKEKYPGTWEGNLDGPYVQRLIEIDMFFDEIYILKNQVRKAHAESLTK